MADGDSATEPSDLAEPQRAATTPALDTQVHPALASTRLSNTHHTHTRIMSERDAAASTSMQKLAPPGHTLHHSHRSTGRPSRAGDSFIYPERRPSSLSSPPLSPRASLNLHEYPPLSPTATVVDSATHKKKKTLAIIPSRSLLSSVAGGVYVRLAA